MRYLKKTVILGLCLTFLLTGCAQEEQLEIGAWKENLQGIAITPEETLQEIAGEEDVQQTEGQTNNTKTQTSLYDLLFGMGEALTDQLIKDTLSKKHTVEDNGFVKVKLIRVVDGDTLLVNYKGETYVRLIGINTPESVHPDESENTEEGLEASNYTKELLADTEYVWLEFDTNMLDSYDRVLAYVWLANDTSNINNMLNAQLLQSGNAEPMTVEPNIKYSQQFEEISQ